MQTISFTNGIFRNTTQTFCKDFVSHIIQATGKRWILVALYALGDTYLLCALAATFKQVHCKNGETLSIVVKEEQLPLTQLFPDFFDAVYTMDSSTARLTEQHLITHKIKCPFERDSALFIHPHHINDTRVDDFTNIEGVSQAHMYAHLLRLPIDSKLRQPQILQEQTRAAELLARQFRVPKGQAVVLCPDANSWPSLPDDFWEGVSQQLSQRGWAVYTNATGNQWGQRRDPFKGSQLIRIPLELALPFFNYCGWVVGALCGLTAIVVNSQIGCKKTIVVKGPQKGKELRFSECVCVKSAFPFASQRKFDGCDYDIEEIEVRDSSEYEEIAIHIATGGNADFSVHPSAKPIVKLSIPSSLGEVIDKMTILELKLTKLGPAQRVNVGKELAALSGILSSAMGEDLPAQLREKKEQLRLLNARGWDLHEIIARELAASSSDESQLMESVRNFRETQEVNRERVKVKNEINQMFNACWLEEKS